MKPGSLFILLFCYCYVGFAQGSFADSLVGKTEWKVAPLFVEDNKIVYKEEVQLNATYTKDHLYSNALTWYTYNFKNKGVALTINDKTNGRLAGRGILQYNSSYNNEMQAVYFKFEIVADYGKYNYKVYDISGAPDNIDYSAMYMEEIKPTTTQKWDHKYRYEMISDMETYMKLMIARLKESMDK